MSFWKRLVVVLGCFLPLYGLDQGTKWLVVGGMPVHSSIAVIPGFFNIVHVQNTGAAFGIGRGANEFFLVVSAVALVVVLGVLLWGGVGGVLQRLALLLLLPGVAGNLTDRMVHGHVVDFLDFILPYYGHWPAFNIADTLIFFAAVLLVVAVFMDGGGRGEGREAGEE